MKAFEIWNIDGDEKRKNREKKENDENEQVKQIEFQKMKEKIYLTHHSQEELEELYDLVKKWVLSEKDIRQKVSIEDTEKKELEVRLQELSESYDEVKEKYKYLPSEFIVTRSDILGAIYNEEQRKKVCSKIKNWLYYLGQNISPSSSFSLWSFFFWGFFGTNRNLAVLQEFYIDTSSILKEIDN